MLHKLPSKVSSKPKPNMTPFQKQKSYLCLKRTAGDYASKTQILQNNIIKMEASKTINVCSFF